MGERRRDFLTHNKSEELTQKEYKRFYNDVEKLLEIAALEQTLKPELQQGIETFLRLDFSN